MNITDDKGNVVAKVTSVGPKSGTDLEEGIWVEVQAADGTRPTLCLVKGRPGGSAEDGWYLGVFRDAKKPGVACDLAVSFSAKDGPMIQAVRGKEVIIKSLFDLLA